MDFIAIEFAVKFIYFAIGMTFGSGNRSVPSVLRRTIQFEAVELNFHNGNGTFAAFQLIIALDHVQFVCFHIKIFQSKMHNDDLSTNTHLCF